MSDVEYLYTRRRHSEVERAHIIETVDGATAETLCGLSYGYDSDFANTTAPDDLPELVCRTCKRSHRAE